MFGFQKKKNPPESEATGTQRLQDTCDRLSEQLLKVQKKKRILLEKVVESRQKGLTSQEKTARALLSRALGAEQQINGMIMSIELAVQARDLAVLSSDFMECIGFVADDISRTVDKADGKKAKDKYLRILYASKKQKEKIDAILEAGDYDTVADEVGSSNEEYEKQIDAMIAERETGRRNRPIR